jgi:hypothetical protein
MTNDWTRDEPKFHTSPDAPCITTLKARLFFRGKSVEQTWQINRTRMANRWQKPGKQNPLTTLEVRRAISTEDFWTTNERWPFRFLEQRAFQIFYASSKGLVSS